MGFEHTIKVNPSQAHETPCKACILAEAHLEVPEQSASMPHHGKRLRHEVIGTPKSLKKNLTRALTRQKDEVKLKNKTGLKSHQDS